MEVWGFIFMILFFLFLFFHMYASDLKGDTNKEKYAIAISNIAQSISNGVSGIARFFLEPADKAKIRHAKEYLVYRNAEIYRYHRYHRSFDIDSERLNRLFRVDSTLKESLETLGLSEDRWKMIAIQISYVGCIRYYSREFTSDGYKPNRESYRKSLIDETVDKRFSSMREHWNGRIKLLKSALSYFQIPEDEWIKYGDAVIEMHRINDDYDIPKYGIVAYDKLSNNETHYISIASPDSF